MGVASEGEERGEHELVGLVMLGEEDGRRICWGTLRLVWLSKG